MILGRIARVVVLDCAMTSTFDESRDDEDQFSELDSQADFLGELNRSVSRLRELSHEMGDGSVVHLEHTLDAILNMARKTTFDESITSLDSLRVAKPVQKSLRKEKESTGSRFCNLRVLLCGKSEKKDDNLFFSEFASHSAKLGNRSKESFWKEARSLETSEHRKGSRLNKVEKSTCDDSNGFSTNSKKDLVVRIGRKHRDDVSSLSSDLFGTKESQKSETRPTTVARSTRGGNCLGHYEDLLSCRSPHRQLPVDDGHSPFIDLLACHTGQIERRQELGDETNSSRDHDMKILGVRNKGGSTSSIRSQSTGRSKGSLDKRKSRSKISRVEAEHSPKATADQMTRSDRATIYIYNQATDQARRRR